MKFATVAAAIGLLLTGGTPGGAEPQTVAVSKTHYSGKWLEIGRRPMFITDGCVAGYSIYKRRSGSNEVAVEDGCFKDTPDGARKTIAGTGTIANPADGGGKMRVRYPYFITFDYWVLYESPDAQWFISSDPRMYNLWIYARTVPSKRKLAAMVRKAAELGYPVEKLEFPMH